MVGPQTRLVIKLISGTLVFVGLVLGFIERRYAPIALVTDDSTILPSWVGWAAWLFSGVAAAIYVLVDIFEWRANKRRE